MLPDQSSHHLQWRAELTYPWCGCACLHFMTDFIPPLADSVCLGSHCKVTLAASKFVQPQVGLMHGQVGCHQLEEATQRCSTQMEERKCLGLLLSWARLQVLVMLSKKHALLQSRFSSRPSCQTPPAARQVIYPDSSQG